MAIPKVFISSTCFDLGEIRDQLQKFIRSFGFEPILSEYGDIFYHPDLHTHDACISEVSNCQIFILIIGGRFGGSYVSAPEKSITNAEYEAARKHKLPIFSYVKKGVLNSHHVYKKNKDCDFVGKIEYPSIENNNYALNIFRFIDDVRRATKNNAIEPFDKFIDIENHLRKQFAGMFFDFLKSREVKSQIDATNHLISGLSTSSQKLEELVKSLYREISSNTAESKISDIEAKSKAEEFFNEVLDLEFINNGQTAPLPSDFDPEAAASVDPHSMPWHQYLIETGLFYATSPFENSDELSIELHTGDYMYTFTEDSPPPISKLYELGVKKLSKHQRLEVLNELVSKHS